MSVRQSNRGVAFGIYLVAVFLVSLVSTHVLLSLFKEQDRRIERGSARGVAVYQTSIEASASGISDDYLFSNSTEFAIAMPSNPDYRVLPPPITIRDAAPREVIDLVVADVTASAPWAYNPEVIAASTSMTSPSGWDVPSEIPIATSWDEVAVAFSAPTTWIDLPLGLRAPALDTVVWVGSATSPVAGALPDLALIANLPETPTHFTSPDLPLVPEPSTIVLAGVALAIFGLRRHRPRKH